MKEYSAISTIRFTDMMEFIETRAKLGFRVHTYQFAPGSESFNAGYEVLMEKELEA